MKHKKTIKIEQRKAQQTFLDMCNIYRIFQFKTNKQPVETSNSFRVLEDCIEEDIDQICIRQKILTSSRKNLMKCKKCHFKKRHCLLYPNKCKADQKYCKCCKKIGHFPRSLKCRLRNKNRKQNNNKITVILEEKKITKKNLKFIKRRILELELMIRNADNQTREVDEETTKKEQWKKDMTRNDQSNMKPVSSRYKKLCICKSF